MEIINFINVGKSHFFFLVKSLPGFTVKSDKSKDMSSIKFHNVAFTFSEKFISDNLLKCNIIKGLCHIFLLICQALFLIFCIKRTDMLINHICSYIGLCSYLNDIARAIPFEMAGLYLWLSSLRTILYCFITIE